MMNEVDNTVDASYIQDLAENPYGRPAGRLMREAMSTTGERPTSYVTNFVAQRTVAALPAWQQTPFRDEPITDNEVQRWWANWDAATMHMTLPHFVLHQRNQRPRQQLGNEQGGEHIDVHHTSQPRRAPQRTRLVGGRPSLLFDPGSKINLVGGEHCPV